MEICKVKKDDTKESSVGGKGREVGMKGKREGGERECFGAVCVFTANTHYYITKT